MGQMNDSTDLEADEKGFLGVCFIWLASLCTSEELLQALTQLLQAIAASRASYGHTCHV